MHVPIVNDVVRSTLARTGPPARARTKLRPTVRKSVLFPAMFEPLTINKLLLGRVVRETACPSGRHSRVHEDRDCGSGCTVCRLAAAGLADTDSRTDARRAAHRSVRSDGTVGCRAAVAARTDEACPTRSSGGRQRPLATSSVGRA